MIEKKIEQYLNEVGKDINKSALKKYLSNALDDLKYAKTALKQMEVGAKFKDELDDMIEQIYQFKERF